MKKLTILLSLTFFSLTGLKAQISPSELLAGSAADINYLANGYLSPFGNALSESLNNGWYQTAKTHNLGRFDLMITPTVVFIPDADKVFTINNSQLDELQLSSGTSAESPTAFGAESGAAQLEYKQFPGTDFNLPTGIDLIALPVPMAKLSVGLIKNTELSIRYLPEISVPNVEDGKTSMFGIGVKHDILQWIPKGKLLPFSASAFFGYTRVDYSQSVGTDQELALSSSGVTFRALVSKKILFITPYAGFGLNTGNTDITLTGAFSGPRGESFVDPISITTENSGSFVGNVGVRLKFLLIAAVFVDYTFGDYNAVTSGLGVSVDF
jgi:hypothetical protein